jgi:hypothetical protein
LAEKAPLAAGGNNRIDGTLEKIVKKGPEHISISKLPGTEDSGSGKKVSSINEPYVGEESYIFASYARADYELVMPELSLLQSGGYRLWWDRGISAGLMWPDQVADRLEHSYGMLLFLTQNAVKSRNVYDEVCFALDSEKKIVPIYLENVELTPGLKLRLGAVQAIKRYNLSAELLLAEAIGNLPRRSTHSSGTAEG